MSLLFQHCDLSNATRLSAHQPAVCDLPSCVGPLVRSKADTVISQHARPRTQTAPACPGSLRATPTAQTDHPTVLVDPTTSGRPFHSSSTSTSANTSTSTSTGTSTGTSTAHKTQDTSKSGPPHLLFLASHRTPLSHHPKPNTPQLPSLSLLLVDDSSEASIFLLSSALRQCCHYCFDAHSILSPPSAEQPVSLCQTGQNRPGIVQQPSPHQGPKRRLGPLPPSRVYYLSTHLPKGPRPDRFDSTL